MFRLYRSLKNGIRNLIYWFPIIWQDRNWDHDYIFMIMRHKISDMEKSFKGSDAWSVEAKENSEKMKMCVDILDRLIENDYNKEGFDVLDETWGKIEFKVGSNDHLSIIRKGIKTPEDEVLERTEFLKAIEKEDADRKTDIKDLFENIEKNIERWWD